MNQYKVSIETEWEEYTVLVQANDEYDAMSEAEESPKFAHMDITGISATIIK